MENVLEQKTVLKFPYDINITLGILHELLFRHIFETQIHIQTQIRKTFTLALATNDFF